jgi:hypothetical protein
MGEEIAWKEHEIHYTKKDDEDDNGEEDVFDFFAKQEEEYEHFELEFSGLPKLVVRGLSECSNSTGLGLWNGADVLCDYLLREHHNNKNSMIDNNAIVWLLI